MQEKKKSTVKLILLAAIYVVCCIILWSVRLSQIRVRYQMAAESTGDMTFRAKCDFVDAVSVSLDDMSAPICAVHIEVYDGENHLCGSADVKKEGVSRTSFSVRMLLLKEIRLIPGHIYHVQVTDEDGGALRDVSILLCGGSANVLPLYILFCILIGLVLWMLCFWYQAPDFHFQRSFVLVMVLLGMLSSLGIKPLNAPDEGTHFAQAYALSSNILRKTATQEVEGKPMVILEQSGLLRETGTFSADETFFFYTDINYGNDRVKASASPYVRQSQLAWYSYLPGAAGITVARLLNLPYQMVLLSGRISSILFLALMAVLSMRIYPAMSMAVAAICLLPKTIWIGASCSYDVWNLAFAFVYLALLFRIREQEDGVRLRDLVVLFITFALFVPVKFVYAILGLGIFLIPIRQWKKHKEVCAVLVIVIVAAAGILIVSRGREAVSYLFTSNMDRRGFNTTETSESYTMLYVLHHPVQILLTYINSLFIYGPYYVWQLASGHYLRDYVPHFLAFLVVLVFMLIMMTTLQSKVSRKLRAGTGLLFLLGILIIETAYMFVFSVVPDGGIGLIDGVQGRYFLPFLYFLPFCMHRKGIVQIHPADCCRRDTTMLMTGFLVVLNLMIILMKSTAAFADASLLVWGGTVR